MDSDDDFDACDFEMSDVCTTCNMGPPEVTLKKCFRRKSSKQCSLQCQKDNWKTGAQISMLNRSKSMDVKIICVYTVYSVFYSHGSWLRVDTTHLFYRSYLLISLRQEYFNARNKCLTAKLL